jgi:hypothetical protein
MPQPPHKLQITRIRSKRQQSKPLPILNQQASLAVPAVLCRVRWHRLPAFPNWAEGGGAATLLQRPVVPGLVEQRHRHVLGVEGQQAEHVRQQLGCQQRRRCRCC